MSQLTFWSEEPLANHSVSRDCVADLQTTVATLPFNIADYFIKSANKESPLNGLFGKTSPVFLVLSQMKQVVKKWKELDPKTEDVLQKRQILQPCLKPFGNAGIVAPGGCWTLNILECPNDAVESSLSDILEQTGDHLQRYFLSPAACAGILRRAEKRKRKLPELLLRALKDVVQELTTQRQGL